ncbi:hypothetical protein N24_2282 [Corynebacterium suranareeae]|uniref:DUF218 domain-containing protein n=1 Tax=Corynebacterium suranareeae TaxID=2506452 RepID=A0A160PS73_9CORY|nr:YdcF family protein [Corynebacterium suranareeae]BAU96544.1 hypothetical protein N24_2282 [Corynebacterium suranareeae]
MLVQPLYFFFGFSLLILAGGIFAVIKEPRRLYSMAFVLLGAFFTFLSLLVWAAEFSWAGNLPQLILITLLAIPLLGYPLLTLFLLSNGVLMVRRESRTGGNLLSLLFGVVMLLAPLLPVLLGVAHVPAAGINAVTLTGVGLALYLGGIFLVFLCSAWVYRSIPPRKTADYVIILGSGVIGSTVPPLLAARLNKAIELAGDHAMLIPSGGKGSDEDLAEGVAMARYLEEYGIPPKRIIVEDRATTTKENLLFSMKLIEEKSNVLVATSDYHVFRTALLTRDLGIDATVRGGRTAFYYVPSAFIREFIAVCRDNFKLFAVVPGLWIVLNVLILVSGIIGS